MSVISCGLIFGINIIRNIRNLMRIYCFRINLRFVTVIIFWEMVCATVLTIIKLVLRVTQLESCAVSLSWAVLPFLPRIDACLLFSTLRPVSSITARAFPHAVSLEDAWLVLDRLLRTRWHVRGLATTHICGVRELRDQGAWNHCSQQVRWCWKRWTRSPHSQHVPVNRLACQNTINMVLGSWQPTRKNTNFTLCSQPACPPRRVHCSS